MKKYQLYWLILLSILCLLSLTISICSVLDYSFLAESYIGIVGAYIGITVTIVIGYQIFSVIEFREDLKKQKKDNQRILQKNTILQKRLQDQQQTINKQNSRIEESINMLFAIFSYKDAGDSFNSFVSMQKALLLAIDCNSNHVDDIFIYLHKFIETMNGHSFDIYGCCKTKENICIINNPQHIYYKKTVKEYIDYCMTSVLDIDKKIKDHDKYIIVRYEYENIMKELFNKLERISEDPCNVELYDK